MALPRYKLPPTENREFATPAQFPFLLVPEDPAPRLGWFRKFLLSGFLLNTTGLALAAALAGLLWISYEPLPPGMANALKFSPSLVFGGWVGICLMVLLLIAFTKYQTEKQTAAFAHQSLPLAPYQPPPVKLTVLPAASHTWVEWQCEEWSSVPFIEILADGVIAEIFSDEMLAPDKMVFSCQVIEGPNAA